MGGNVLTMVASGKPGNTKMDVAEDIEAHIMANPNTILITHSAGSDAAILGLKLAADSGFEDFDEIKLVLMEPSLSATIDGKGRGIFPEAQFVISLLVDQTLLITREEAKKELEGDDWLGYLNEKNSNGNLSDEYDELGKMLGSNFIQIGEGVLTHDSMTYNKDISEEVFNFLGW